ncbi:MAG: NUDIX hydrolase [Myxococcales bacterium]|nr:NUDIX hydrolase [Myxococcales bacterium]
MQTRSLAPLSLLPKSVVGLGKEILRHVLRRPVVGLAVVAEQEDGRVVLIRRGDTGTWALPGGTVEWGETLVSTFHRELLEEAGIERATMGTLVGVYSRPDRDPRFHAVTVVVRAKVDAPSRPPLNGLEIREVKAFGAGELPADLAMGMGDFLRAGLRGDAPEVE